MKRLTHEQAGWIGAAIGVLALLLLGGCSEGDWWACSDAAAVDTFGPTLVTDANGKLFVISRDGCTSRAMKLEQKLEAK